MAKVIKKHGKSVIVIGLTLTLLAMYFMIPQGEAAAISSRKITISDSRPSQTQVSYTFTGTHSVTTVKCLMISFCTTATGACATPTGFTAVNAAINASAWSGWGASAWTATAILATRVGYYYSTGTPGGTAFAFSTASITNPSAEGTYYARVATYSDTGCAVEVDTGTAAFAIVYGVTVTATINETLSFSVATVASGDCDAIFGDVQDATTTASSVAFGTIASTNTFYHGCNDLTVSTNGSSGYAVTGQESTSLLDSTTGQTIDDSTGDSTSMSETASSVWATATNNGFGYACYSVSGTPCALNTTSQYRQFACVSTNDAYCDPGTGSETPQAILSSASAASANQGRIEYKLSAGGTQEAGSYSNVVTYIATPTY